MKRGLWLVISLLIIASAVAQVSPVLDCPDDLHTTAPSLKVTCTLVHPLKEITTVCYQEDCKDVSTRLPMQVPILISPLNMDTHDYTITASSRTGIANDVVTITKDILPSVKLSNIEYPDEIKYSTDFELNFTLESDSRAKPREVTVFVRDKAIFQTARLDKAALTTIINSNLLYEPLPVRVEFVDDHQSPYEMNFALNIPISDPTVLDHISLFFRRVFAGIFN